MKGFLLNIYYNLKNKYCFQDKTRDGNVHVNNETKYRPYGLYIKIIQFLMVVSGLWRSPKDHRTNNYVLIMFCLIMGFGCYFILRKFIIFIKLDELMNATESALFFILFGRVMLGYFLMLKNKKHIGKLIEAVELNFNDFNFCYNNNKDVAFYKDKGEKNTVKFISLMIIALSLLFVTYCWSSRFYLPKSKTKSQIFPINTPWDYEYGNDDNVYYYVLYAFELIVCSISSLLGVLDITMCVGSVNLICAELDILCIAFKNVKTTNTLNRCIKQHYFLIKLGYDVQSVLSFIVMDMFVTCEFMLCLCSFQIYQIYSTTTLASLMKNVCMLTALIVHEFVYFFYGQRLVTKTSNLHQSVYFCNWFDESQPFKTSLSIIQCRTNRPFIILAGKTVPVTLKSFIKCLQAAFSYFNLLRALSHT